MAQAPAREIPRLNLPTKPVPEPSELIASLNRWADAVQTALTQHGSSTAVANQSGHKAQTDVTVLSNTPVIAPNPVTGNMQQGSLGKLPVAPRPVTPVTLDNLGDGSTYARPVAADMTANRLDFSKALLNKQLDNIPDGSTYGRPLLTALTAGAVDLSKAGVLSMGNRPGSITTLQAYVSTTSGITVYWDGTNSSQQLKIYRDDGTISSAVSGSQAITGLSASTKYFIYSYFDETLLTVNFSLGDGTGVGTPAIAFTSPNIVAAQEQIMRQHLSLFLVGAQGITTPASGTGGGTGGGGGGGRGNTF